VGFAVPQLLIWFGLWLLYSIADSGVSKINDLALA